MIKERVQEKVQGHGPFEETTPKKNKQRRYGNALLLRGNKGTYPFRVSRYSEGDFPMIFLNSREK
jgi:hypothetical protein